MLPFTYTCDASFSVYEQAKQYLEAQPDTYKRLSELARAYFSINKLIPITSENMWSGHFFPNHDSLVVQETPETLMDKVFSVRQRFWGFSKN